MRRVLMLSALLAAGPLWAETRGVYLEDGDGGRIRIADLTLDGDGGYRLDMAPAAFGDYFLSMRPFKCVEGPEKLWCHVPYPYENRRDLSAGLTDLEYDLLFVWKPAGAYGIDLWNGVYYRLAPDGEGFAGTMHEIDMNVLAVPPEAGELRPIRDVHLEPADPDSHWLPRLVVAP